MSTAILIAAAAVRLPLRVCNIQSLPRLDSELHVLHVLVVLFKDLADFQEALVGLGQLAGHHFNLLGRADAGDYIFPLRVHQVLTPHFPLTCAGVARKGHTRARSVAHIAKDHGDDADGRAQIVSNFLVVAVVHGALAVPAPEDGFGGQPQLFYGVLGEINAFVLADDRLVFDDELLKLVRRQVHVFLGAGALLSDRPELLQKPHR